MDDQLLSRFFPVYTHDADVPLSDLVASVVHRFTVVRGLIGTLLSLALKDISDHDLTRGVHLLTQEWDGVLEVIQQRGGFLRESLAVLWSSTFSGSCLDE